MLLQDGSRLKANRQPSTVIVAVAGFARPGVGSETQTVYTSQLKERLR
jgi:hypothetical protein